MGWPGQTWMESWPAPDVVARALDEMKKAEIQMHKAINDRNTVDNRNKTLEKQNNNLIATHNKLIERIQEAIQILDRVANQRWRNLVGHCESDLFGDADRYHINKAIDILKGPEPQKTEDEE